MNPSRLFIVALIIPAMVILSCSRKAKPSSTATTTTTTTPTEPVVNATTMAPCIFYKTRADYKMNVPVILSENKSKIVSYPDVLDIRRQGADAYPTELVSGYLLDNRGIGPAVAFLSYSYDDYAKLSKTPSLDELMSHIIDKDPLLTMYRCVTRTNETDLVPELKKAIETGKMAGFIRLK